jgi:hypothetical protein
LGLSLGKTHVLHALLDKGLVKIQNFRPSDNKLAYAYLLTPGSKKTAPHACLSRAQGEELKRLQSTIAQLRAEASNPKS